MQYVFFLVVADVRVHPGDPKLGIAIDDAKTGLRPLFSDRDLQAIRERPLDHVAGHDTNLSLI